MFLTLAVRRSVDGVCDHPVDAECSYFPGPDQLWPLRKVSEKIGLHCRMAL